MDVYALPDRIEAVLFDIDNTLYKDDVYFSLQSELLIKRFAVEKGVDFEEARTLVEARKSAYASANGGRRTSLGNVMLDLGVPIEVSVRWREEIFRPEQHLSADLETGRSISLLAGSFKLAAVTNNPVSTGRRTLRVLRIEEHFSFLIGLDTCAASKPQREPFEKALHELGTDAAHAVSVGDRYEVDLETPLAMGMGGVLVNGLSDLYALPPLLLPRASHD